MDGGPLEMARIAERSRALLIAINVRYKTHAGIRITGLADAVRSSSCSPGAPAAPSSRAGCSTCVGADELVVIANTGDDIEIYGAHVSPDPDLVTFWLADRIDERGWGMRGDTFT